MAQVFASPGRYIQGYGELNNIYQHVKGFGSRFLILISENGKKRFGDIIEGSFAGTDKEVFFHIHKGECSRSVIGGIVKAMKELNCDSIIGVGGGKVMDTAKAAAYEAGTTTIIVPTVAASDAPTSALSVVYTDDGVLESVPIFDKNPEVVLVDTKVIAESPTRLLVAGMGDALATFFEARGCVETYRDNFVNGKFTKSSYALARLCYDTLLEDGVLAVEACNNNVATKALENIIEANTLLSGIGFESNGVTGAHSIYYGFTVLPEHASMYHGEFVAFGTIALLILENRSRAELEEVINFCLNVGLPVCFEDLHLGELTPEKLDRVVAKAMDPIETIHNEPFKITKEELLGAILLADKYGTKFKEAYNK